VSPKQRCAYQRKIQVRAEAEVSPQYFVLCGIAVILLLLPYMSSFAALQYNKASSIKFCFKVTGFNHSDWFGYSERLIDLQQQFEMTVF